MTKYKEDLFTFLKKDNFQTALFMILIFGIMRIAGFVTPDSFAKISIVIIIGAFGADLTNIKIN